MNCYQRQKINIANIVNMQLTQINEHFKGHCLKVMKFGLLI